MKLLILLQWGKVIPYWVEAVAALRSRGVDVSVAGLQSEGALYDLLRAGGVEAFGLDSERAFAYPLAAVRLTRAVRRLTPDAVLGVGSIPTTVAGVAVRGARQGKCIALRNYVEPAEARPFPQLGPRVSHYTMAVSKAAAEAAHKDGVPVNRTCVALNGAAAPRAASQEELARLKDGLGIPSAAIVVAMIARLRPDRGHVDLLHAVRLLPDDLRDSLHLVFVGEGSERARLESAARDMGLADRVHLVGDQSDVGPWFSLADIVVVASLQESFGKTAAEAMAAGKPVVASTTGGLVEFVLDEETGLLFDAGNAPQLGRQLQRLLENRSLAESIGRNAATYYRSQLTIDNMVDRWLGCFASFGIVDGSR